MHIKNNMLVNVNHNAIMTQTQKKINTLKTIIEKVKTKKNKPRNYGNKYLQMKWCNV